MKKTERVGTAVLVTAMIFAGAAASHAAPAGGFSDVDANAWYAEAVSYCDQNGLMSGTSGTEFSPNKTMTRAMLAAALYRQAGSPAVSGNDTFPDTDFGEWYSDAVIWASQNEIITGYANGNFGTNDPVTREQIVTILWRMAGSPAAGAQAVSFADGADISDYASDAVSWASASGIISGRPGNRFDPQGKATRAEVASILANSAKSKGSENSSIEQEPDKDSEKDAVKTTDVSASDNSAVSSGNTQLSAYVQEVADIVNEERGKAGAAPLAVDESLCRLAQLKAEDMRDNDYFDHDSPTYGRSHEMMKQFGVSYRASGENIAMGQRTPEQVMSEWMNSQGHRKNILNDTYEKIGVGYCTGGTGRTYWVQMFIK